MKDPVIETNVVDEGGWNAHKERVLKKKRWFDILMYAVLASPIVFFLTSMCVILWNHTHQYALLAYDVVGLLVYGVFAIYKFVLRR